MAQIVLLFSLSISFFFFSLYGNLITILIYHFLNVEIQAVGYSSYIKTTKILNRKIFNINFEMHGFPLVSWIKSLKFKRMCDIVMEPRNNHSLRYKYLLKIYKTKLQTIYFAQICAYLLLALLFSLLFDINFSAFSVRIFSTLIFMDEFNETIEFIRQTPLKSTFLMFIFSLLFQSFFDFVVISIPSELRLSLNSIQIIVKLILSALFLCLTIRIAHSIGFDFFLKSLLIIFVIRTFLLALLFYLLSLITNYKE